MRRSVALTAIALAVPSAIFTACSDTPRSTVSPSDASDAALVVDSLDADEAAPSDASEASDVRLPSRCAPRDGSFCDDFDDPAPFGRWTRVVQEFGGEVVLVPSSDVGTPPHAARFRVPASDASVHWSALVKELPFGLAHVRCAWTMVLDPDQLDSQTEWFGYRLYGADRAEVAGVSLQYLQTGTGTAVVGHFFSEEPDASRSDTVGMGGLAKLKDGRPHRVEVDLLPSTKTSGLVIVRVDGAEELVKWPAVRAATREAELSLGCSSWPGGGAQITVDDFECHALP